MKKLFVSLGLAAAGTASIHAAYAPDSTDNSKMWSLSGTLRGFYDDNIYTSPQKHGSIGFEANPSFNLNVPLQQTEIGVRYNYGLYYYQQREHNGQNPIDQSHQFDLWLDHAFTPRWEARLEDTVVVAQEPALTASGTTTPQRISGNNLGNTLNASLHTDWTRLLATKVSYQNSIYDYENSGALIGPTPYPLPGGGLATDPIGVTPSYTGLLDRMDQDIALDLEWRIAKETTGIIGYKYEWVNFTGNELISHDPLTGKYYPSNSRDNRSHYGYVGVRQKFLENLIGNAMMGVQYTTYYNDPSATSSLGPYADAALTYTYASGSYAQVGVTESRNTTDTVQIDSAGHITQDQESTVVYASVNHALTPKLTGSVLGRYQYSIYHNGGFNDQSAEFYNLGLNLSYAFTRHFSSDVGYNFDWYTTPVPGQGYTRNRIYLGVTATY